MKRLILVIIGLIVTIITSLVYIFFVISQRSSFQKSTVSTLESVFFGKKNQSITSKYQINDQLVTISISTDLQFPITAFHYSSAFQEYLDNVDFDLGHLDVLQTRDRLPESIEIKITDKFQFADRTSYITNTQMPLVSVGYIYVNKKLYISMFLTQRIFETTYNNDATGLKIVPMREFIIDREIVMAMAQLDRHFPDMHYENVVNAYLEAYKMSRLL